MLNTLTRKFIDEMKLYQAAQQKYKTDIQRKLKRQVKVVKPDATDEEVEEIMKSEGGRDALYKQTILAGGVNEEIRYVFVSMDLFMPHQYLTTGKTGL
jgi:syntaxin 1B/2/3